MSLRRPSFKFNPCPLCGGLKSVTVDTDTGMFKEWCLNLRCDYVLMRPDLRSINKTIEFPCRRRYIT